MINILFIGDIFGKPGRDLVREQLPKLKEEFAVDVCIANGENIASGRGVTQKTTKQLFDVGVDVFTSGNHLWDKKESFDFLKEETRIVKPLNSPETAIGAKYCVHTTKIGNKVVILSFIGQVFMSPVNSPFSTLENILPELQQISKNIIVDLHAEATAEKRAFGFFADGRISAMFGTHTHIQTADEEILPNGTAYITDVGMTGPHNSVIGMKKEIIIEKIFTGMPKRFEVAKDGLQLNAVCIQLDEQTGKAQRITRIKRHF